MVLNLQEWFVFKPLGKNLAGVTYYALAIFIPIILSYQFDRCPLDKAVFVVQHNPSVVVRASGQGT